ncbi:hypothetical protein J2X07_001464 [Fictibacillus barbaricus]|uniref:Uncharacterized protein n=1 Tax=Fictibacillus barbaricus TaxID=182136 RepID=A0ABU1TZ66_9BACL|nr:hypothetical protein [Fictibacillus barbaricus]
MRPLNNFIHIKEILIAKTNTISYIKTNGISFL